MLWNKLIYFYRVIPRFALQIPSALFDAVAPFIWPNRIVSGIRILDPDANTRVTFSKHVEEALFVISQADKLRYRRLSREIRLVVHLPVPTGAQYSRPLRACSIDLRTFPVTTSPRLATVLLACVLVHEATHGYLYSRRIVQTRRNSSRIEKICCRQMLLFARRLGVDEIPWKIADNYEHISLGGRVKFLCDELRRLRS
jgi:hypothetical protein